MRALLRTTRGLLIGAASLYCIILVALGVLWTIQPQRTWWLAFSNIFALYLFAPLLVLAPAALGSGSRWLRGAVALSAAAFVVLFGARFIPPLGQPPEGTRLRVMTINQLNSNDHIAELMAAIRAQNADIVAIQELSEPVAEAARRELRAEYPYQLLSSGDEDSGLGLLSRYPLRAQAREREFTGQRVVVLVGGREIAVINVHLPAPRIETRRLRQFRPVKLLLGYDTAQRASEFAGLLRAIDAAEGPLVVMGDFNTSDREPAYAQLAARLHDAYRETAWGFGFTFPHGKMIKALDSLTILVPLVRIDYVWSKAGVMPQAAQVVCDSGESDHCAVVADLRVGPDDRRPTTDHRPPT